MTEHVYDARATVQMAEVLAVDDAGQAQTVTIRTSDGALYHEVEVLQLPGIASVPAGDGAIALVFAIGGDPANLRALLANPAARFGGMGPGEQVMYAPDGTRVAIRNTGTVEVWGASLVLIDAPAVTVMATGAVTVTAGGGVTVDGNVHVTGTLTADGGISDGHGSLNGLRGHYNIHTHTEPGTNAPTPTD